VAEGIFAAEIVRRCEAEGLLGAALCLRNRPSTTAWRRLRRDVRESRKALPVLVRRGWRLMRAERAVVARQVALGATPCGSKEALRVLGQLRYPGARDRNTCGSAAGARATTQFAEL
jgi:uridine kinase